MCEVCVRGVDLAIGFCFENVLQYRTVTYWFIDGLTCMLFIQNKCNTCVTTTWVSYARGFLYFITNEPSLDLDPA